MRTEAGEAGGGAAKGVQAEAHAAPPPPVKHPHPARRPGSTYTPDIHLPPRASEREAEREKLRESWRSKHGPGVGQGIPEAAGEGWEVAETGEQAVQGQEGSWCGAVPRPLSAAPPPL